MITRLIRYELGLWRSLYRWIVRRGPAPGTFGYARVVTPIFGVFIGMSAIEIPIVHLMLPWPGAQKVALALGAYGLFWMIGLLASLHVHPHQSTKDGLRVRYGLSVDIPVPWSAVASIRRKYRSLPPGRTVRTEDGALHIAMSNQTSVDVILREPTTFPLPKGTSEPVTELRFYADDPDALVATAPIRNSN